MNKQVKFMENQLALGNSDGVGGQSAIEEYKVNMQENIGKMLYKYIYEVSRNRL